LIESLLGTFMAFPTMVAVLGLAVGGVVIANSVALTTMERRHEIAIMKSIGLQRERVLAMLLLENGILGLIGGLIGVGIGLVGLALMIGQTGAPSEAIPYGSAFLLMGLCIVVAIIAALTSAWGASGEKPLNVLRYE
jgi:putative ABC transport system permease protein